MPSLSEELQAAIESGDINQLEETLQTVLTSGIFNSNIMIFNIMTQIAFMIHGLSLLHIVPSNIDSISQLVAADDPPPPPREWVGKVVSGTGLASNPNYTYNPAQIPVFPPSDHELDDSATYMDLIDFKEKNVLSALIGSPDTLVFKMTSKFYIITKSKLFELMNDPDLIKYECAKICDFATDGLKKISDSAMQDVPYLSTGSLGMIPGLVSFSHLRHIIVSQQPQQSQAYELVDARRPHMLSMASHNFLFGPGSAGARAVSAAHCQTGQDATAYEIRTLPIAIIRITIEQLQIKLYTLFFHAMDPDDPALMLKH